MNLIKDYTVYKVYMDRDDVIGGKYSVREAVINDVAEKLKVPREYVHWKEGWLDENNYALVEVDGEIHSSGSNIKTTTPINNYICKGCKNNRLNKDLDKSCWHCGVPVT